jgi:plastocyanin
MENNPMNKKKILLLGGGVLVIIALVVIIIMTMNQKKTTTPSEETNTPTEQQGEKPETSTPGAVDQYREEVPGDVKVPGMNETLTDAEKEVIAVPSIVTPAAPGASASFRSFSISGDGGKFVPAEIIARLNDIVHVNFTAVDKDYDIVFPSYGMRQSAKKGETKILEYQAVSEGSYTYYCDSCGGANSPAQVKIIVVK